MKPEVITSSVPGDADDPAIWVADTVNHEAILIGNDKAKKL